ncbi:unnamed protein product [Paramecium sonneborni]|uniref:Uncharacterized protein n=1 Tax=Paramecium sonneborni TaxID=65129 RepID=A0A8S1RXB2_9CILI|nr:unnamed protein product [Paramecium sonneborni]
MVRGWAMMYCQHREGIQINWSSGGGLYDQQGNQIKIEKWILELFQNKYFFKASLLGLCLLFYQIYAQEQQLFTIQNFNKLDVKTGQICSISVFLAVIRFNFEYTYKQSNFICQIHQQQQENQKFDQAIMLEKFALIFSIFFTFSYIKLTHQQNENSNIIETIIRGNYLNVLTSNSGSLISSKNKNQLLKIMMESSQETQFINCYQNLVLYGVTKDSLFKQISYKNMN